MGGKPLFPTVFLPAIQNAGSRRCFWLCVEKPLFCLGHGWKTLVPGVLRRAAKGASTTASPSTHYHRIPSPRTGCIHHCRGASYKILTTRVGCLHHSQHVYIVLLNSAVPDWAHPPLPERFFKIPAGRVGCLYHWHIFYTALQNSATCDWVHPPLQGHFLKIPTAEHCVTYRPTKFPECKKPKKLMLKTRTMRL